MKITIITSPFGALPPNAVGAVEKLFHQLAGEWARNGHRVSFVCAGGGDNPKIEYVRLRKYERTGSTKTDLIWDFIYSIKAIWSCPKTDVLVCNTFWSPVFAPLMRWKYKKLIYGVHRYPKRQYFLYLFVHKFICVSSAVAEPLKLQVASKRICVVVNPIDTAVFNAEPRHVVKGRVLYAGRVHPLKGLRCLAEACGRLFAEGVVKELVLVGPYELSKGGGGDAFVKELKAIAAGCPLTVTGAISDPAELAKIERTTAVFVYPSEDVTGEAFGIAPLEAMSLGAPVVVSNLKCFEEFVADGVNALVFNLDCREPEDDLEMKLKRIIGDQKLRERLVAQGIKTAADFSVEKIANEYLRVLER